MRAQKVRGGKKTTSNAPQENMKCGTCYLWKKECKRTKEDTYCSDWTPKPLKKRKCGACSWFGSSDCPYQGEVDKEEECCDEFESAKAIFPKFKTKVIVNDMLNTIPHIERPIMLSLDTSYFPLPADLPVINADWYLGGEEEDSKDYYLTNKDLLSYSLLFLFENDIWFFFDKNLDGIFVFKKSDKEMLSWAEYNKIGLNGILKPVADSSNLKAVVINPTVKEMKEFRLKYDDLVNILKEKVVDATN